MVTGKPKKELGQHWLFDEPTLRKVAAAGGISSHDTVLEVGPGLGTLTELLVKRAKQVVAVEADSSLLPRLKQIKAKNLTLVEGDIMKFDLRDLPLGYKVVANIPYYLTSNLLRTMLESSNPPVLMSLLVQKEVAERIVAAPGQMNLLAFSVQYYAQAEIIDMVPKELFTPPPQVDSAIIKITRHPQPAFAAETKLLFRLVKAGFSGKRKQLKNSLAAGLQISSIEATGRLRQAGVAPTARAQELSLPEWARLYAAVY